VNRKPLFRIRTFLAAGINTIPMLSFLACLYSTALRRTPNIGLLLYIAGYMVLAEMTRCYVDKLFPFLALHILPYVPAWLLTQGHFVERIIGIAAISLVLASSFVRKAKREGQTEPFPIVVVMVVLLLAFLVTGWINGEGHGGFQVVLCYCYLAMLLLESFLSHFLGYVQMEERTNADIPERKLFAQGSVLAFGYAVFVLGMVALLVSEDVANRLGHLLKNGLLAALRFLVSLLPKGGEEQVEEVLPQVQTPQSMPSFLDEMETGEPSLFLQIVEKVLIGAVVLCIAAVCLYGFFAAVRHFLGVFGDKTEEDDLVEDLGIEERREKLPRRGGESLREKLSHIPFGFQTPEEKIRRSYRKFAARLSTDAVDKLPTATVRETMRDHAQDETQGERLAILYEKARYTQEECTAEDARAAVKLSRTLVTK